MRLDALYNNYYIFDKVASEVQNKIDLQMEKFKPDSTKSKLTWLSLLHIKNKIEEAKLSLYFSHLINSAVHKAGVTDIDKIVYHNYKPRAIFELKWRSAKSLASNGKLKVNWSQFKLLQEIEEKLDIPVFYIIRTPVDWRLIKLRSFYRVLSGKGINRDYYAEISLDEGLRCNEVELIHNLRDVLTE